MHSVLRLSILIAFISFPLNLSSQVINESVVHYQQDHKSIFKEDKDLITMEFVKSFEMGKADTSYYFILDIYNKERKLEGVSLGYTLFNISDFSTSNHKNYSVDENSNNYILEKDKFLELYSCTNELFKYIGSNGQFETIKNDIVATCNIGGIQVGGEHKIGSKDVNALQFYLKVGLNTVYTMDKIEFIHFLKTLREIDSKWKLTE